MKNIRIILTASLSWSLLIMPLICSAQNEAIGFVKTVTGEAWVTTAGQRSRVQLGVPIFLGSQLKTSAAAAIGVAFKDNTMVSLGPDTDMTVDEYLYAPSKKDFKFGARLSKGSLNYVSGVIAKLKPDAVTVKTPGGIIGVRGTQFVARVEIPQGVP